MSGEMPTTPLTLPDLLARSARLFGPREVLGTRAGRRFDWIHYRDLDALVKRATNGLLALGLERGDRVAIVANNRVEWVVLAFAVHALGGVYVPMYEAQAASEWEFILADARVRMVFSAGASASATLREMRARLPALERVLTLDVGGDDSYEDLLARGAAGTDENSPPGPRPEDLATLIYTSGTTGLPKGVMLSHQNITSNVVGASQRFDFGPSDRSLAFLPWAHAFGQTAELYSLLYVGASMAICDDTTQITNLLGRVRPTVLIAVPRVFNRVYEGVQKQLLSRPFPLRKLVEFGMAAAAKARRGASLNLPERAAFALSDRLVFSKVRERMGGRLRFVVSGSAALSPKVAEFIDALGIDVFEGYGLTEASPVVSANYPGHHKIGSVGPAFPFITIGIDRTVTGDPLIGEILVSGPNVMLGYHQRPEETAAVLTSEGALRTGDMGYLDGDGFLHITGRIKEQYKLENGKYVVPSPLEEQLKLSPYVQNVMLYGENKPYNVALVVPDPAAVSSWANARGRRGGDPLRDPDLKRLISAELESQAAGFKSYEKPRDVLLIGEDFTQENGLLTPSLKLKRRKVLEKYRASLDGLYQAT
jgi:long-chain acyl-CoA synthetase